MKKRFKIFELRKKNLKKIHLTKLTKLIQKENNFSILSRLNHILIHEYLLVAVKSKKIFLFITFLNSEYFLSNILHNLKVFIDSVLMYKLIHWHVNCINTSVGIFNRRYK